jgi:hypothetical protein
MFVSLNMENGSMAAHSDVSHLSRIYDVSYSQTRLVIPVFTGVFFRAQKQKKQDSWGFLFLLCFPEEFFTGTSFWGGRSNSCGTGFLYLVRIPVPAKRGDCYYAAIGSLCDSASGVDSGEYAGMCPHHLTAAHVDQAFGILLQIWNLSKSKLICDGEMRWLRL